jgi:hypothetical protein
MTSYYFIDAHQALSWTTEVLRRQRFPRISPVYKELLLQQPDTESRQALSAWFGEHANLPTHPQDRHTLALEVQKHIATLEPAQQQILRLKYWGDYHDPLVLARALKEQDILRQKGIRTRVSYRYSDRQLGVLLTVDHKTAGRRIEKAIAALDRQLILAGLALNKEAARRPEALERAG